MASRDFALLFAGFCLLILPAGCGAHRRQTGSTAGDPGSIHFQNYCAACHQYDGQGMGDAPPLADSPWVKGPEDLLIKVVLHGVRGRMEISGQTYDQEMPGFGAILSDADVASLLSFVRRNFGGPPEPITPKMVSRVRAAHQHRMDYWRVEELLNEP